MALFGIFGKKKKLDKTNNWGISASRRLYEELEKTLSLSEIIDGFDYTEISRQKIAKYSKHLYQKNEYAQGIVDRYTGKIINNGLLLESCPNEKILMDLGVKEEDITEAMFDIEAVFSVWKDATEHISIRKKWALSEIQRIAFKQAHILGDVLIFVQIDNGFPKIEIIGGDRIITPPQAKENVEFGVEFDELGAESGYYVLLPNGEYKYISSHNTETGRRQAWLFHSSDLSCESVRGRPFLEVVIRSLHEIGVSFQAEQTAMKLNAKLAISHRRGKEQSKFDDSVVNKVMDMIKPNQVESNPPVVAQNGNRELITENRFGYIIGNAENDEVIESFDTKRPNLNVANFIMECVKTIARAKSIPPEVFLMEYNTSYSASTNARNDFYELQKLEASRFIVWFLSPIYREFLIGMVARGILIAPKYINAVNNGDWLITGAWEQAKWRGSVEKPIDLKLVKSCEAAQANGWLSPDTISVKYFDTDFYNNMRRIRAIRLKYPEFSAPIPVPATRLEEQIIAEEMGLTSDETIITEDGNKI